jgi:hypothetical protein
LAHKKLEAVIVTENGETREKPLGIITSWDLVEIDAMEQELVKGRGGQQTCPLVPFPYAHSKSVARTFLFTNPLLPRLITSKSNLPL